jgi:hypothetical protein
VFSIWFSVSYIETISKGAVSIKIFRSNKVLTSLLSVNSVKCLMIRLVLIRGPRNLVYTLWSQNINWDLSWYIVLVEIPEFIVNLNVKFNFFISISANLSWLFNNLNPSWGAWFCNKSYWHWNFLVFVLNVYN